ncbi:ER lectin-like protein [Carex rostrata]
MGIVKTFVFCVFILVTSSTINLLKGVAADQIITSSSGSTFGRTSREPRYNIEYHSPDSVFHPENGQESVIMKNKDGISYNCYLPIKEETKTVKTGAYMQNLSSALIENDKKILKTPDELLDVLKDEPCLYRHEGWWSYELCYQKTLRQVHVEDDKVVQEFVLGQFDPEATSAYNEKHSDSSLQKDPRSKDASQRYHAHQYTNGTICDLTDMPRETEVRYICSGTGTKVVIGSIKEISSCKYVATVQAPMLCKHPMFQQERPALYINCIEIRAENEDVFEETQGRTHITLVTEEPEQFAT